MTMLTAANLETVDTIRHGFFTRKGGASEGVLASLNCGHAGGDDPDVVATNRARAMERLGMPPSSLCMVKQVHGKAVHLARQASSRPSIIEADALVTDRPGIALGVLSADCAPILIVDPEAAVIGAAHAGWRGALAGVAEATVDRMVDLGARPDRMTAAIGPCIALDSYQVGPDMLAAFEQDDPAGTSFFKPEPDQSQPTASGSGRWRFDLKGYVLSRLACAGIENREALADDTFSNEDRFFSARRSRNRGEERFGLLLSAIAIRG